MRMPDNNECQPYPRRAVADFLVSARCILAWEMPNVPQQSYDRIEELRQKVNSTIEELPPVPYVSLKDVELRPASRGPDRVEEPPCVPGIPVPIPEDIQGSDEPQKGSDEPQKGSGLPDERSSNISSEGPKQTDPDALEERPPPPTKEAQQIFKAWYEEHKVYPYLRCEDRVALMSQTGCTRRQVLDWFTNRRRRDKRHAASRPSGSQPSEAVSKCSDIGSSFEAEFASQDFEGLAQESSASHRGSQEVSFASASTPQLDRYRETAPEDETVRPATAESLSRTDGGPRFVKRKSCSGHTYVGGVGPTDPKFISKGNETSNGTGLPETPSVHEHPRKKGKRIVQRPPVPPEREGNKIFQCRYCYHGFPRFSSWIEHEKSCGPQQLIYVCMKVPLDRYDSQGQARCPFCGIADSSEQHLNDRHRHQRCLTRPIEERGFQRYWNLNRHWEIFHRATERFPESWATSSADAAREPHWCGFCGNYRGPKAECDQHIGYHFMDPVKLYDMTCWIPEPKGVFPG